MSGRDVVDGDRMELTYALDGDDFIHWNEHYARYAPQMVGQMRKMRMLLPLFAFAVIAALGAVTLDILMVLFTVLLGAACAAFVWATWPARFTSSIRQQAQALLSQGNTIAMLGARTLTVSDDELVLTGPGLAVRLSWAALDRAEVGAHAVYLYQTANSAIMVPLRAFDTAHAAEQFAHACQARIVGARAALVAGAGGTV